MKFDRYFVERDFESDSASLGSTFPWETRIEQPISQQNLEHNRLEEWEHQHSDWQRVLAVYTCANICITECMYSRV